MIKPNPFVPRSGIEPKVFVNRDKEIDFFKKRIRETKSGVFNHYVILGGWGVGKTALLRYLKIIAQGENCPASYFTATQFDEKTTLRELTLHLFKSIIKNLPFEIKKDSTLFSKLKGIGLQILGSGISIDLEAKKDIFIDPQIFLTESLISLWEEAKNKVDALIILIDDIQNYSNYPEIFTLLKNVLSSESIIKKTKYLFIFSSTSKAWNTFLIRNHPIGRYFIPQLTLKNFSEKDTKKLIDLMLENTDVKFSEDVKAKVCDYTLGHLFEIHALCSKLYDLQDNGFVGNHKFSLGLKACIEFLGGAVFESEMRLASDKEKRTLFVLSHFNDLATPEQITVKSKEFGFEIKGIHKILERLVAKNLTKKTSRGHYLIEDKLLKMYILSGDL